MTVWVLREGNGVNGLLSTFALRSSTLLEKLYSQCDKDRKRIGHQECSSNKRAFKTFRLMNYSLLKAAD
jgi:hypothetical protein